MYKFRIALLTAFLTGFLFSSCSSSRHTTAQQTKPGKTYYSCPMHTEVIEMNPGKCPKCGMEMEIFDFADLRHRNSGNSYNPHINSGGSSGGHSGGHH